MFEVRIREPIPSIRNVGMHIWERSQHGVEHGAGHGGAGHGAGQGAGCEHTTIGAGGYGIGGYGIGGYGDGG